MTDTPPSLAISGAASVNEGSTYTLNLSASDPGADPISNWTINWGDGSLAQDVSGNPSFATHIYADGPNSFTIRATATDQDGTFGANTVNVIVNNVPPSIPVSGARTVNVGSPYTLFLGTVVDPGADTVTAYLVHWGDGQTDTFAIPGTHSHTYSSGPATRNITVDLVDADGTYANVGTALDVTTVIPPSPSPSLLGPGVRSESLPVSSLLSNQGPGRLRPYQDHCARPSRFR